MLVLLRVPGVSLAAAAMLRCTTVAFSLDSDVAVTGCKAGAIDVWQLTVQVRPGRRVLRSTRRRRSARDNAKRCGNTTRMRTRAPAEQSCCGETLGVYFVCSRRPPRRPRQRS